MNDKDNIDFKLKKFTNLILQWNTKINLISFKSGKEILDRHINDSFQLINYIKDKNIHIVDLGSGAGFPGIILSFLGIKEVTLIEVNERKAAFLLQASKFSDNKINIVTKRVESLSLKCDIITARGFTSLSQIFNLTQNYIINEKFLLLKGATYHDEIIKAKMDRDFQYITHNSLTSKEGKVLEIKNVVKK